MPRVRTIRGIVENVHAGESFTMEKGEFLDAFYSAPADERPAMIGDEPEALSGVTDWQYAFSAGMAHMLADGFGLPVPPWVFKGRYYLADPAFSDYKSPELRKMMMLESPPQMKHRNIFTFDNTLSRA